MTWMSASSSSPRSWATSPAMAGRWTAGTYAGYWHGSSASGGGDHSLDEQRRARRCDPPRTPACRPRDSRAAGRTSSSVRSANTRADIRERREVADRLDVDPPPAHVDRRAPERRRCRCAGRSPRSARAIVRAGRAPSRLPSCSRDALQRTQLHRVGLDAARQLAGELERVLGELVGGVEGTTPTCHVRGLDQLLRGRRSTSPIGRLARR